jgi:hypothetical protein
MGSQEQTTIQRNALDAPKYFDERQVQQHNQGHIRALIPTMCTKQPASIRSSPAAAREASMAESWLRPLLEPPQQP